ncbi:MAG: Npt1/Npt2 family nucleotide transporter [bacterium]
MIKKLKALLQLDSKEMTKLLSLALGYFFIIGSYSVLRSLKTPIFMGFVGKEWQPASRFITLFSLIPCMFFYSKLVDRFKRHQLVYVVIGACFALSFTFALFFAHPAYGIKNTITTPYRLLGWAFEVFMDVYSALVITTYWSFVNSICTPEFAGKGYGIIVAISRIGGIATTTFALLFSTYSGFEKHTSIPLLALLGSLCLIGTILCVRNVIKKVPEDYLHGYEAAYQLEQKKEKSSKKTGIFEGINLMIKEPYVLGIFAFTFCMENIATIFDYQFNVLLSVAKNNQIGDMSTYMFAFTATFQVLGLILALFGTTTLIKKIGIRRCLMVMPLAMIALTTTIFLSPKLITMTIIMIVLRALNYGFNYPIREMLYIPTVKDIQFKSKAWIESFGKPLSKASGSTLNWISITQSSFVSPIVFIRLNCLFSFGLASIYTVVAYLLGKKHVKTIERNEVIGNANS